MKWVRKRPFWRIFEDELNEGESFPVLPPYGRHLRIAIVVETFARDMGYVNNTLPKYLARMGHQVDLITADLPPYFQLGSAEAVYGKEFAERNRNRLGSEVIDGYTVHTLRSLQTFGYPRLSGLHDKLSQVAPDLVCIFNAAGWTPLACAPHAQRVGYKLVIGSHMGETYFPLAQRKHSLYSLPRIKSFILRTMPGWFIGSVAHHCVVPTKDCADVAINFFGIPRRKVRVMYLPVDVDFFHPICSQTDVLERQSTRASLGITDHETVCVFSGKFTRDKNPDVLLNAVQILAAEGHAVRAMFIASGEQREELVRNRDAVVLPFMPIKQLGGYFRAADIGVWMNESISFLDGAACGLPLLLSDTVKDVSHLTEFITVYRANDAQSLASAIRPLLDPVKRQEASRTAARLANERFSAQRYASRRVEYFLEALAS